MGANRLNGLIDKLERNEPAFGTFVSVHSVDKTIEADDLGFDFVIYDMEHSPLDFHNLRISMQFLLNREKISKSQSLRPAVVPLVRIPPKAGEDIFWMVKQVLDQGAYGILLPHVATVEQAQKLVDACCYATPTTPNGQRGCGPFAASRYWGLPWPEYTKAAAPWPLQEDGEIAVIPLIENLEGVDNVEVVLDQVKGISAVLFGLGDLSVELGVPGELTHPSVEAAYQKVLSACLRAGVGCMAIGTADSVAMRLDEGCAGIISMPQGADAALSAGRKHLAAKSGGTDPKRGANGEGAT